MRHSALHTARASTLISRAAEAVMSAMPLSDFSTEKEITRSTITLLSVIR